MIQNHKQSSEVNERAKNELERDRERFDTKYKLFVAEKEAAAEKAKKLQSERLQLDVGGTHIAVGREVLTSVEGSELAALFAPGNDDALQKQGESVQLDRNGKIFQILVDYLRNEREELPVFADDGEEKAFKAELDYWKIETNDPHVEEQRLRLKLNPELIEFLDSEPRKANETAKLKWCELGPFRIHDILGHSTRPEIDYQAKFGKDAKNAGIFG